MRQLFKLIAFAICLAVLGCDKGEESAISGHQHAAPHGGVLAELGDHQATAEMVLDREAGTITLYVLDAHAENAVRVAQESISASIEFGDGEPRDLALMPVASELTGETAGDTSQFRGESPLLKHPGQIYIEVMELKVGDKTYELLAFDFPSVLPPGKRAPPVPGGSPEEERRDDEEM